MTWPIMRAQQIGAIIVATVRAIVAIVRAAYLQRADSAQHCTCIISIHYLHSFLTLFDHRDSRKADLTLGLCIFPLTTPRGLAHRGCLSQRKHCPDGSHSHCPSCPQICPPLTVKNPRAGSYPLCSGLLPGTWHIGFPVFAE